MSFNRDDHFDWNDAAVSQLKALYADGLSAARIAIEMGGGLSRNAVISKAHRIGLLSQRRRSRAPAKIKPQVQRRTKFRLEDAKLKRQRVTSQGHVMTVFDAALTDLPADESADAVRFLDRDGQTCCWPLNDVFPIAEHMVCNTPCGENSYCERHHEVATQPYRARPVISDAERARRVQQGIKNLEQARAFGGR